MILTTFRSVNRAYVDHVIDEPWTVLADLLTTHIDSESKAATPMFNFAEFKSPADPTVEPGRIYHGQLVKGEWFRSPDGTYDEIPNSVRRCKNNVLALNGIVLDVDEKMTIQQAQDLYKDIEYVLYTTFRHTPERHKFRIVIPFSQPLLAEDIPGRQESITETFPGVDRASFTVSQSFYFHSGLDDPRSYWNEGVMVDPYAFEYREPKIWHPTGQMTNNSTMDEAAQTAYKEAVVRSLMTCSGLHYAGTGSNHAVLTLVSLCRSVNMTFEEYDQICARIAHPDSQLTNPSVRVAAWTGWSGNRLRRETRDAFIKEYGGTPIKVNNTNNTQQAKEQYQQQIAEIQKIEQMLKELK
jgi:hypothetical protein